MRQRDFAPSLLIEVYGGVFYCCSTNPKPCPHEEPNPTTPVAFFGL